MRFFLDNMISPKFARALREVNKDVTALREKFAEETLDEEWIPKLAALSPVLMTLDRHIRTRPLERKVLSDAGITTLFLGPFFSKEGFRFWDQFVWLVRRWSVIEETSAGLGKGSCMLVQQNGKMYPLPKV
jgi:hypothetical protein